MEPRCMKLCCGREKRVLIFEPGTVLVGRGQNAHITGEGDPKYQYLARRHAVFSYQDGMWYLEDLQSMNGTFVNEHRLSPFVPYRLVPGDRIRFAFLEPFVFQGTAGAP